MGAALVLEECPFCHKFLAAQLVSREEVDTGEILKEKDVLFKMGISIETGERIADQPEAFITYKFTYRCKDCGKEWTKFSVKEVGLPEARYSPHCADAEAPATSDSATGPMQRTGFTRNTQNQKS
jgi:hypothetical protein